MNTTVHSLLLIAVMAGVTMLLRFLPFIVFSKGVPKPFLYLEKVLPYSIMAMLVVYCLRNVGLTGSSHGIPEAIAILLVVIIHKRKHNTLLSIVSGTLCYMFLIQVILV